jgi:hypothetical protein
MLKPLGYVNPRAFFLTFFMSTNWSQKRIDEIFDKTKSNKKDAGAQNRTADTRIFSPLLYRLSYPGGIFNVANLAVHPKKVKGKP